MTDGALELRAIMEDSSLARIVLTQVTPAHRLLYQFSPAGGFQSKRHNVLYCADLFIRGDDGYVLISHNEGFLHSQRIR
jgi:hypothetical protein